MTKFKQGPTVPTPVALRIVFSLMGLHLMAWVLFVVWNYSDARLESWSLVSELASWMEWTGWSEPWEWLPPRADLPAWISQTLGGLTWLAILTSLGLLSALYWGPLQVRSTRYLGALCIFATLWLALGNQWRTVSWMGHRARSLQTVTDLQKVAERLSDAWPTMDGEDPDLGPFMAYPRRQPSTLILLKPGLTSQATYSLMAIDRDPMGHLRFEISDGERTFWLEYGRDSQAISSTYTNGIGVRQERERSIPVNARWQLARYR